ncbi:MAG: zinc-binding dehydrogenase, partial [Pseudonocardiaceae bacterium]
MGHPESSGWAECATVPTSSLAVLPSDVLTSVAASLPLAGLTALRLTRASGPLASQRVLIDGASGGVGHFFVELAASQGALVTAVVGSVERGSRLVELGAANVITEIDEGQGPYDLAISSVGGDNVAAAWRQLTPEGTLIWMGQASGRPITMDFLDWEGASSGTLKRFSYLANDVSVGDDLATLLRLTEQSRLHPEIGLEASWQKTPEAIRALL